MQSVNNEDDKHWSALLGHPRTVLMAYVGPSGHGSRVSVQVRVKANVAAIYQVLHWRPAHIQDLDFAELDRYDIRGLSAMIHGCVPYHPVR